MINNQLYVIHYEQHRLIPVDYLHPNSSALLGVLHFNGVLYFTCLHRPTPRGTSLGDIEIVPHKVLSYINSVKDSVPAETFIGKENSFGLTHAAWMHRKMIFDKFYPTEDEAKDCGFKLIGSMGNVAYYYSLQPYQYEKSAPTTNLRIWICDGTSWGEVIFSVEVLPELVTVEV